MKTVWILNHYAVPPLFSGGTRHYCLAKYLLEHNWNAYIIAAGIIHNTGKKILANERFRLEFFNKVPFLWINAPSYKDNGVRRILNMSAYTLKVLLPWYTSSLPKPDVIIGSQVHPFAALAGLLIAKQYNIPFIFEVRDLWPRTLIDMNRISENGLPAKLLGILEKYLSKNAMRILVLLPNAAEYFMKLGIPKRKISYIPNGIDLDEFPINVSNEHGGVFQVMYFGAHGNANDLENLLNAMAILNEKELNPRIMLRLIGDGPLKSKLIKEAQNLGLRNVVFDPPVAKNKIPLIAAEADAFIFNLVDSPVFKYGISSNKLFEFMAASRPIIFCCSSANNPIELSKSGVTVPPENPLALANTIESLSVMNPRSLFKMGNNGRKYVTANHDYRILSKKLSTLLNDVFNDK